MRRNTLRDKSGGYLHRYFIQCRFAFGDPFFEFLCSCRNIPVPDHSRDHCHSIGACSDNLMYITQVYPSNGNDRNRNTQTYCPQYIKTATGSGIIFRCGGKYRA